MVLTGSPALYSRCSATRGRRSQPYLDLQLKVELELQPRLGHSTYSLHRIFSLFEMNILFLEQNSVPEVGKELFFAVFEPTL